MPDCIAIKKKLMLCHVRVWHIIRVSHTKGNAVARAFLTCLVFGNPQVKKKEHSSLKCYKPQDGLQRPKTVQLSKGH